MKKRSLYFTAPHTVEVREETIVGPGPGEVLVTAVASAISPGTEMLIYRGQAPEDIAADTTIEALGGRLSFPLKYGYALVGRVTELGTRVDQNWLGREVFAFHPHESHFVAPVDALTPLPEGVPVDDAIFLPNMETAVNLVHDGAPLLGERVIVFGQGVVGLLTTALLSRFPLEALISLDRYSRRRALSLELGAGASLDPAAVHTLTQQADLCYEVSGAPQALNMAIETVRFGGRVVIGSWYGTKRVTLDLGGHFHRGRIQIISSQVSTLNPALSGRWTKTRRLGAAWPLLSEVRPSRLITHTMPVEQAADAYHLLEDAPDKAVQVVLRY